MNNVSLNTISLNNSLLNIKGKVRKSDSGGESGGGSPNPIEKPIGVFIYTADGKFITSDDWDTANNDKAVGIFVNDGEHDFVIAKKDANHSELYWGGCGIELTSIPAINSRDNALLDFDGAGNTPKIIAELAGLTGAPAAEECANFVFPNGKNGYLPAFGEWNLAYANKIAIDNAMMKCGGEAINPSFYWSSTQNNADRSWKMRWSDRGTSGSLKNFPTLVRAFCKI